MASGSVPITAGSGTPVRVVTNAAVDSGANQQVFSLAGQDGTLSPFDPDGTLQVSPEPAGLFIDDFSGSITTYHTTGGTAPSTANGSVTFSTTTTAGTLSYCRTIGTFMLRSGSYLLAAYLVKLEAAAVTNQAKWWGLGLYGTPSATVPIVNGAIFMTDGSTGNLYAALYSASTRTFYVQVTRPTDAALHRYEIRYRQSIIYWLIDGVLVASSSQPNLAVANNLASTMGSAVNASNAAGATPAWSISSEGVSDLSATHRTIGDGAMPWLQASVKAASTAAASTDLPLVVALHPSSGTPALAAGANLIGAVGVGAATPSSTFYTSTTTNAAQQLKTSAGQLQSLWIQNTAASTQYLKLFNATSVTLGTTAAVLDIPVAAGAILNPSMGTNGWRFTTGMAFTVTGATGTTNNTAGAGGVICVATFV